MHSEYSFCSLIHDERIEKIFMPKYKYCDERGKFKSGVRIALWEKFYSYGRKKQRNKETKNKTKAQQKKSQIFRKLRVTSAFPFETTKGNVLAMYTAPFRAE